MEHHREVLGSGRDVPGGPRARASPHVSRRIQYALGDCKDTRATDKFEFKLTKTITSLAGFGVLTWELRCTLQPWGLEPDRLEQALTRLSPSTMSLAEVSRLRALTSCFVAFSDQAMADNCCGQGLNPIPHSIRIADSLGPSPGQFDSATRLSETPDSTSSTCVFASRHLLSAQAKS